MNHDIPDLQIHIHKVDGSTTIFFQNDAGEAKRLLDEFQPELIFSQDRITFMDEKLFTWLPVSKIARVDLVSEQAPHLLFPVGIVNAVELEGADYQALIQNPEMREQRNQMSARDASLVIFLDLETAGGQRLFLTMETEVELQSESLKTNGFPFEGSGLCYRMRNGGVSVLNLANLTRLTFFPGPFHAPVETWRARLFNPGRQAMHRTSNHPDTPINVPPGFTFPMEQTMAFPNGNNAKNHNESDSQMERKHQ